MEDSLGAIRDWGSGSLLRARGVCEYDPIVRRYQGWSDFSLFQWVKPTPNHNDWTVIEYPSRGLCSSASIEEKGRGRETRLANVGFRSEEFGGFAKSLP